MSTASSLPPLGDNSKSESYVKRLIRLIEKDKVKVFQTDLNKFDLTTMQNHYRVDIGEYDIEVSHSVQPDTDKDFYTMIFNSIRKIQDSSTNKVILTYLHLTEDQYRRFKIAADEALERQKRKEDAVRFVEVMKPLDNVFNQLDPEGNYLDENNSPMRLDTEFADKLQEVLPPNNISDDTQPKVVNPFDQP